MIMTGAFFHRKCSEESSMINGKVNLNTVKPVSIVPG
jgi:hypothetical protein